MTGKPVPDLVSGTAAEPPAEAAPEAAFEMGDAGRLQQSIAALVILAVAGWITVVSFDVEDPQPYLSRSSSPGSWSCWR